jgi:hypothetical protein
MLSLRNFVAASPLLLFHGTFTLQAIGTPEPTPIRQHVALAEEIDVTVEQHQAALILAVQQLETCRH